MDLEAFERVYETFGAFHAEFAPLFRRRECRQRARDYLQGLLVQSQERRNAENLAELLPVSARVLQRFLTESPWEDDAVIARLQQYLGPRLSHSSAVWAVDASSFPKQGTKSVGVARQYCGALGKLANCQVGVFLAHVGPRGRALVDKRLYLHREWTDDPARCEAAGVPRERHAYRSQTQLALEMLLSARSRGSLQAAWVTGDDAFGMSPDFRDGLDQAGFRYVLEVPRDTPVWPQKPTWETPPYSGFGRPPKARPVAEERQTVAERAARLPTGRWQERTVAQGAQGPRTYQFAFERVRETREGQPGKRLWLIHRRNLDGSEPRDHFSNASKGTPRQTLSRVSASRWPIETEFETDKSDVGLDEYEVRGWAGWHHHMTMCLLASAFLLELQQEWGKKDAPDHAPPSVPGGAGVAAAGAVQRGGVAPMAGGDATAQRASPPIARETARSTPLPH
jgi:SRSO17 transposase